VSTFSNDASKIDDLLKIADEAMYTAKKMVEIRSSAPDFVFMTLSKKLVEYFFLSFFFNFLIIHSNW